MTILDARVHYSSARNARMAFVVTTIVVTLLTATVAADRIHPVLALLLGLLVGLVLGAVVWLVVRIWPAIRLLWWWTPEITLATAVVYGWTALAHATVLPVRLAVVGVLVGVPGVLGSVRRRIWAVWLCLFVRHRLRVCFTQFIIANRSGSVPFILIARPTMVGERVWIYLRPGLSLSYLQANLERIAVACRAKEVTVEAVPGRSAAYLRVDTKRREVLTEQVDSPLIEHVDPNTPTVLRPVADIPTALDLPDVADPATTEPKPAGRTKPSTARPAPQPVPAVAARSADGEDVSDWVD